MIKDIVLENFRGIKTGQMKDFSRFNLFIGPNNSGKTTLLEALYLLFVANRMTIVSHEGKFFNAFIPHIDLMGHEPLSRIWRKHGFKDKQEDLGYWDEGRIVVGLPEDKGTFELSTPADGMRFQEGEENKIGYLALDYTKKGLGSDEQRTEREWLDNLLMPGGLDKLPLQGRLAMLWHRDLTYDYRGVTVWGGGVKGGKPTSVVFYDVLTAMKHISTLFYARSLTSVEGWLDQVAERFNRIFNLNDAHITFLPYETDPSLMRGYISQKGRRAFPIDTFGDGARGIFKFLLPLMALKPGSLVLWEDPELFQHTDTLELLLREVVEVAREKDMQVFLATQSMEVLGWFAAMTQEEKLVSDEVRAYRMKLEEGVLSSGIFSGEQLHSWLEMGFDPRKLKEVSGRLIYHSLRKEK